MTYDFDRIIDRKGTDSLKYDFAKRLGKPENILPLWVADMDFAAPPEVVQAMVKRCNHGIFGYSASREHYFEVVRAWYIKYYDWEVKREWLVKTPGVVYAVTQAIHAYTSAGDGVLIQEPVYYPFRESIEINNRKLVVNELVYHEGSYTIDFEDFEQKTIDEEVKVFILCSPHNPVGRVWTERELMRLGEICLKHGVLVIADEIHSDFIYPGHEHHVFADLNEAFEKITITCTSPSKTFNLAGLQLSNVFIADTRLRRLFRNAMTRSGYALPNIMGLISCSAAYTHGHPWLEALLEYLKSNLDYLKETLRNHMPEAIVVEPEGTYLVWVDFSKVARFKDMGQEDLDGFMVNEANLWLDGGTMFGAGGEGFQRFNIACPRAILEKAMDQLIEAANS